MGSAFTLFCIQRLAADLGSITDELPAYRITGKSSITEYRFTAQVCSLHAASQFLAQIWRDRVALMQFAGHYSKFSLRVEDDEVRIIASGYSSFASFASSELRRPFRHPARDFRKRKSSLLCLGPHHWERQ